MIKLLLPLLLIIPIYGENNHFKFPDHHSRFLHHLNQVIKKSDRVVIVTPSLNHSQIKKMLLSSVKKGGTITLIVNHISGDPLSLVQYRGIHLYLSSHPFSQSTLLVGSALLCSGNENLDEERLGSLHSSYRCTKEPKEVARFERRLQPLLSYTKPYLNR